MLRFPRRLGDASRLQSGYMDLLYWFTRPVRGGAGRGLLLFCKQTTSFVYSQCFSLKSWRLFLTSNKHVELMIFEKKLLSSIFFFFFFFSSLFIGALLPPVGQWSMTLQVNNATGNLYLLYLLNVLEAQLHSRQSSARYMMIMTIYTYRFCY